MNHLQEKLDVMKQLRMVQQAVVDAVESMSEAQFNHSVAPEWSAAAYLTHLILSVKPVVKALNLPQDKLRKLFGTAQGSSRSYAEITAAYSKRLSEGARAEDYPNVTPDFYRFPDGVTDQKRYLTETWAESNTRLLNTVEGWDEAALDSLQMPHPAIGMVTVREMLYFTLHHNSLHWHDIQRVGGLKQ